MKRIMRGFKKIVKNKILFFLSLIVLGLVFFVVFVIISDLIKKTPKINNLANATKEQIVEGIKFYDTKIEFIEGRTSYVTMITNTTDETKEINLVDIYVYDMSGTQLTKFTGYVGRKIHKNEIREITCLIDMDLHNAYRLEYKFPIE